MTMSSTAPETHRTAWPPRSLAGWLGLAASPTFALMACIAARDASPAMLCAPASSVLPVDGMTAMYLLMTLFHLPPWLKLASRLPRAFTQPTNNGERP